MNFNVYLNKKTGEKVTEIARSLHRSRNSIVNEALEEWLGKHTKTKWPAGFFDFSPIRDIPDFESLRDDLKDNIYFGGIIYNQERNDVLNGRFWSEHTKEEYRQQPKNIEAAIELIRGEKMFLHGTLQSKRIEKPAIPDSHLPYSIRQKICSYLDPRIILKETFGS